MPFYYYEAVDYTGYKHKSLTKANSKEVVVRDLEGAGLYVVKVYRVPAFVYYLLRPTPKLKTEELIEFLKGVGYGIKAGLPLLEVLVSVQEDMPSRRAKAFLEEVLIEINRGARFSRTLAKYSFIPPLVLSFVEVGEETGNLGENMLKAAERLTFIQSVKSQVKSALVYPLFSLAVIFVSLGVWIFFVIPKFAEFLSELHIEIPFYTRILLQLAFHKEAISRAVMEALAAFIVVLALTKLSRKFRNTKVMGHANFIISKIMLHLPIVGRLAKEFNLFLISSILASLISAGVNLDASFYLLRTTVANGVFQKAIDIVDNVVREGNSLAEGFERAKVFPNVFTRYVAVGERTGTLSEQFEFLASYYKDRMDSFLSVLPKVIEPTILVIAGGVIVFMVVAVFVPIYNSVGKLLGGL